jgi:RNA polymerase sigma factor (sigma-70 family)
MRDNPVVAALVIRARSGDQQAWDLLVERYAPLVWSICRRYGLSDADAGNAGRSVWLRLVNQLDQVREPAGLPEWLATATRRECSRFLRDADDIPGEQARAAEQQLLVAERHIVLREAFTDLPPRYQQLIALLIADPPVSNAEISARLDIPPGDIESHRARCLDKLRRHPAMAELIDA